MMKRALSIVVVLLLSGGAAFGQAAQPVVPVVAGAAVSATNPLPVTSSSPTGTQDVNLKQVNGGTVDTGHGTATGAQRVELPTDGTGVVGLNAGTAIIGKVGIDQTTPGTTNAVALIAGQNGVAGGSGVTGVTTQRVVLATDVPLPAGTNSLGAVTAGIGITPTDRTITSASGSSQTLMALNAARKQLTIVNTGNANCGVNPTGGTAVIGGAGTLTLAPLGAYTPRVPTLSAITVICTTAQPIYADES